MSGFRGDGSKGDSKRDVYKRAAELFNEARTLPVEERDLFLESMCDGDAELLEEARSLLCHHGEAEGFLNGSDLTFKLPHLDPLAQTIGGPDHPERVGPYRILQVLGEGGMGTVFLAEQTQPFHRRVALKVIKLGMNTREVVARFEAERQALAMMSHPNIARIHDAGVTVDGRPYFVMEFVPGEPITQYCDRRRLSTRKRLELFISVCEAVQHAHQKAIIHRDLKPSNILVTEEDGKPVPKIIDFGVAKATNHRLTEKTLFTEIGQLIGTPEYMSPEQAEMGVLDIDTRTDIYSLGVLLYELVVGTLPFDSEELRRAGYHEIQRMIREVDPPKPSTRLSSLGPDTARIASNRSTDVASLSRQLRGDLDWITMKAMEKDRSRRYGTASDLAQDIVRHLSHEPVLAGPPGAGYRLRKLVRKHRGPVIAVGAIFLILVIGLVAITLLYGRAERARSEADASAADALRYAGDLERAGETIEAERNAAVVAQKEAVEQRDAASRNLYVAQMRLAFDDWDKGQISRLRKTLRTHLPEPGQPDLRGWEWYYLLQLCHQEVVTLRGHRVRVSKVRWSPDGRRLASVGGDGTIRIWDPMTGEELRRIHGSHYGGSDVAWSPDGKRLASTIGCGGITIWDADSGLRLVTLEGSGGGASSLDWAPEGELIATSSPTREIQIWDASSGQEVQSFGSTNAAALDIEWSPRGDRLATLRGGVTVWDAATGRELCFLAPGATDVFGMAWSPDDARIATGSYNRLVRVFEASSGAEIGVLTAGSGVDSVRWSPDGRNLAAGTRGQRVQVWDIETFQEVRVFQGHEGWVDALDWSPDGKWLASGASDGTVKIWDVDKDRSLPTVPESPKGWFLSWSPTGRHLAAVGPDGVSVWDIVDQRTLWTVAGQSGVTWSPDGSRIAICHSDYKVTIHDALSGVEVPMQPLLRGRLAWSGGTNGFDWSLDGRKLAGFESNQVKIWDSFSGEVLLSIGDHRARVYALSFSPDGGRLVYSTFEGPIPVWDVPRGRKIFELRGHRKWANALEWSPDGTRLITGGWDQTFKVWDMTSGKLLYSLDAHTGIAWAASWSPDGSRFATHGDELVKVWDADSGEELVSFPGLHYVDWSPDGRRIATRDAEERIAIWDASAGYTRADVLEAEERARNAVLTGIWLARDGKLEASDAAFAQALHVDPSYPIPYHDRGLIHWERGFHDRAVPDFHEAVSRDPHDRLCLDLLARCLVLQAGSSIESGLQAVQYSEDALRLCGDDGHFAVTLGMALYRAQRYESAKKALDSALQDAPEGSLCCERLATYFLAMACWRLGDRSKALDLDKTALHLSGDDLESHGERAAQTEAAALFGDLDRIDEAWLRASGDSTLESELTDRVAAVDPDHARTLVREYLSALSLQRQGNHAEAISAFERIIEVTHEYIAPLLRLAESHRARGDSQAAASCLVQALETAAEDDPRLWELWLLVNLGDLRRPPETVLGELLRLQVVGVSSQRYRALLEVLVRGDVPEVPREIFEEIADAPLLSRLRTYSYEYQSTEIRDCLDTIGEQTDLVETPAVGGRGGHYFRDVPVERSLVVGFEFSCGAYHGRRVVSSITPLFHGRQGKSAGTLRGGKEDGTERVEAAPGYAVGGLIVDAGDRVNGFRIRFFRIGPGGLDPDISYESPWVGGPGRGQPMVLGGTGEPVVGIYGHCMAAIDALGLVLLECEQSPLEDYAAIDRAIARLGADAEALRRLADRLERSSGQETRELRVPYLRGRELQLSGRYHEATLIFDDLLSQDQASVEPIVRLGESLLASGQAAAAETRVRRAIEDRFAAEEDVWKLWFRLSFVELGRSPAEVLRTLPRSAGPDVAYARSDLLWLLWSLSQDGVARMNCGGATCVDVRGAIWGKDRLRRSGRSYASETRRREDHVPPELFAAVTRFSSVLPRPHGYRFPVPPGKYRVTLLFHEPSPRSGIPRRFQISIDGRPVLRDYSPPIESADRVSREITVSDGVLEVELEPLRRVGVVSGIELQVLDATLEQIPDALLAQDPDLLGELGRGLAATGRPRDALRPLEQAVALGNSEPAVARELSRCREALLPDLVTCASIDASFPDGALVVIPEGADWRYFRGVQEPSKGLEWTRIEFDDSGWEEGRSGFGFGDDDDGTVLADMSGHYSCVYIRRSFDPGSMAPWDRSVLSVVYDDGFIAYLNGSEIGRAGAGGSGTRLPFNALADSAAEEPLVSTEIVLEPKLLRPGPNVLAIQGLNCSLTSSDLTLIPVLRREVESDPLSISGLPRVVRALEAIGTSAARRLLDDLARHRAWPSMGLPSSGSAEAVEDSSALAASTDELEAAWTRLMGDDLSGIEEATADLVRAGDAGVAFVRKKVRKLGEEISEDRASRDSARFAAFRAVAFDESGDARLAYLDAWLLQRQGRHEEAKASFEEAVRLDPASVEPVLGVARSLRSSGDPTAAARRLREALNGPALGSRVCWNLWFEIMIADLARDVDSLLDELSDVDSDPATGGEPSDEYALRCRAALEELRASGVNRVEFLGPERWPPVVTVAYWRFEVGSPGRLSFDVEDSPRTPDGQPWAAALDSSGHGNHLYSRFPWSGPRFGTDVPAPRVPQTGQVNRGSLDDRGEPPTGTPTQDLYSYSPYSGAPRVDVQSFRLRNWTVEASFRLATLGRIHGILVKTTSASDANANPSLQLMIVEDGTIRLEATDATGTLRAVASPVPVEVSHWYHVAVVSDGSRLKLYVDRGNGDGYQLEDETSFGGALADVDRVWCVGRGEERGQITRDARAVIDEVRISAVALPPERFLFAEYSGP